MCSTLALARHGGQQPKLPQNSGAIGPQAHARACFTQLACFLKNLHVKSSLAQSNPRSHAAYASPNDRYGLICHSCSLYCPSWPEYASFSGCSLLSGYLFSIP
jgi:hypothetical protein